MKKCICVLLVLNIVFCLIGCEKVPEMVVDNAKSYPVYYGKKTNIEYIRTSEIERNLTELFSESFENIELPSTIKMTDVKAVYDGEASFQKDRKKHRDEYANLMGIHAVNWEDKELEKEINPGYISQAETYYIRIEDNGAFGFLREDTESEGEETGRYEAVLNLHLTDSPLGTCRLDGEEVSLESQLTYVNKWLVKKWNRMESTVDYKVSWMILEKYDDGNNRIIFMTERTLDGVPLDVFGEEGDGNEDSPSYTKASITGDVYVDKKNCITEFSNDYGGIEIIEKEEVDRVVSPVSAARLVEAELSGFRKVKIEEIRPMYDLELEYGINKKEYFAKPGRKMKLVPVYCFMIKKRGADEDGIESNCYSYIKVNMINGEIYSNLSNVTYV